MPDENQHSVRLGDGVVDEFVKIDSGRDAFDVHEYGITAELGGQPIVNPADN